MPIALCLEDLDSGRFIQCVAIPGGRPGLGLRGGAVWKADAPCLSLWETADARLALERPEGAPSATLLRGERSLEVPTGKPVILVDGGVLAQDGHTHRVHLHGATRRVRPPQPLRRSRPSRLAVGLVAASALIEVRCTPPKVVETDDYYDDPAECGQVVPTELDFGTLLVGDEPATLPLRLDNLCSDWMELDGFTVVPAEAPFRVVQAADHIDGDDSATITIVFEPEEVGDWEARLVIAPEGEFPEVVLLGAMVEAR